MSSRHRNEPTPDHHSKPETAMNITAHIEIPAIESAQPKMVSGLQANQNHRHPKRHSLGLRIWLALCKSAERPERQVPYY